MAEFRRHLIALTLGCLPGTVLAESGRAAERQLDFTVFSAQPIRGLAYVATSGAAPRRLVFYPTARSPQYSYAGPASLQFVDVNSGAVVAEVMLPPDLHTGLLLFAAEPAPAPAGPRYRVSVVDDSTATHPPGALLILNNSGLKLSGTINRRHVVLQDGANGPYRLGASRDIELRTPFRGRSYQSYAATLALDPAGRAVLLLCPPYRPGSLEVQSRVLLDAPPAPPATRAP
jgi:hypothetical protein